MARRYYSSTAARTTLASGVDDTTTTFNVVAVSGWPATYPYTLVIDQDTVNEELVEVSARSGTTLTVTRGVDGTSAVAHDAGAAVNHGVSARDFDEPNEYLFGTGSGTLTDDLASKLDTTVTTKGDMVVRTAAAPARLPVGPNNQVLTADGGETRGVKWAYPAVELVFENEFSSTSALNINNCFSSSYTIYEFVIRVANDSVTNSVFRYRMRTSASDDTSANYQDQVFVAQDTTLAGSRAQNATNGSLGITTTAPTLITGAIHSPFEARTTQLQTQVAFRGTSAAEVRLYHSAHNVSTSYDGLSIYPASGTISGEIKIYGLR